MHTYTYLFYISTFTEIRIYTLNYLIFLIAKWSFIATSEPYLPCATLSTAISVVSLSTLRTFVAFFHTFVLPWGLLIFPIRHLREIFVCFSLHHLLQHQEFECYNLQVPEVRLKQVWCGMRSQNDGNCGRGCSYQHWFPKNKSHNIIYAPKT